MFNKMTVKARMSLLVGVLLFFAVGIGLTGLKNSLDLSSMLGKMVPDIRKTAGLVQEISASCREQNTGSEQINKAMQQLDNVIQQNVAVSEEMTATSEELSSQAEQLQCSIAFFKTDSAHAARAANRQAAEAVAAGKRSNVANAAKLRQPGADRASDRGHNLELDYYKGEERDGGC